MTLSVTLPSLSGPGSTPQIAARTFAELDERLLTQELGVLVVRAPVEAHGPIGAHASRRLRTTRWSTINATLRAGAPLFREIATHLGLEALSCEPTLCAEAIATAAAQARAAIIAPLPQEKTWDRLVAGELARDPRVVILFITADELPDWESTVFELGRELAGADKLRWLSAIAEEAHASLPTSDLRELEAWWQRAHRVTAEAPPSFDRLSGGARKALTELALAGRSIPVATIEADALQELTTLGLAVEQHRLVGVSASRDLSTLEASAPNELRRSVAMTLLGSASPDPWAFARAAELLVSIGAYEEADRAITSALRVSTDQRATFEIATRWFEAVSPVDGEGGLTLRLKAAQRALLMGEAADAQRWCESAAALDPSNPLISLLMGRALMQLGDLVSARVCLQRAEAHAPVGDAELLARVAAERAEAAYFAGELDQATGHAARAVEMAKTTTTRLAARGTLGKILLARGAWEAADEHFAEDSLTAAGAGETTAELRARLNRAIALLSKGRLDEARTLLERVLDDGTKLHEERARAYALSNLGLVAYRQHDYGAALQYWERTIRFPQALRGRLATALTIGNLADLRLRLGLVDHAEHAIVFGRKLLSGSAPPRCAALFKWVSAQIALARRNTELARREIEGALVDAQASGDRDYLESAWIVAARVALEDGDLGRAANAISQGDAIAKSPRARAEIAIVRAAHLRAMGQPALESANEALSVARTSGEEDLLSEIYTLLAMLHRDFGDLQAAQAHCCRAIAIRDQVAANLPAEIRAAFLAKPEIVALSRLQSSLASEDIGPVESQRDTEPPRTQRARLDRDGPVREIIGDDPAIRALLLAIKKVSKASSTVLIRGESGTGKELVAEALHRASDRASGPLVSVNCAALVETLLLSELFGHEKGAFTGASARRRGRFEMAEGGTLFLDEIGDISPRTQVALLRVLQEKTFERVGGAAPIRANVRVICATHRDLRAMVERGEFREDLYYRLRGITLEVPALRARIGDLGKIAEHLLSRIAIERNEPEKRLSSEALELLARHRWPGNIRELENVLRTVSLFAEGEVVTATDVIDNVDDIRLIAKSGPPSQSSVSLRAAALSSTSLEPTDDEEVDNTLPEDEANATSVAYAQVRQGAVSLSNMKRQIERDCIARALAETKGNITRAAALLGMKRPRLSQLVKQYSLSVASSEGNS